MKLYSTDLSGKDPEELRNLLAQYYSDKAIAQANKVWYKKNVTDADMEAWINEKS